MIGDILQPTHLIFILVVALLVLGPKRLPEAGRALGKGIRDFRSAIGGEEDRHSELSNNAPAPPPTVMTPTQGTPFADTTAFGDTTPHAETTHADAAPFTNTTPQPETAPHTDAAASPQPPVDHAIRAAVRAATATDDAGAEPAEAPDQSAQSAHSV
jgi:sec-independent protein translocase protein TatA